MKPPIGFTKESAYELATKRGMHPGSANAVMEFIAEVQSAALAQFIAGDGKERALQRMHENEVELGLDQQFWDTSK
jgi:hypothetical protein